MRPSERGSGRRRVRDRRRQTRLTGDVVRIVITELIWPSGLAVLQSEGPVLYDPRLWQDRPRLSRGPGRLPGPGGPQPDPGRRRPAGTRAVAAGRRAPGCRAGQPGPAGAARARHHRGGRRECLERGGGRVHTGGDAGPGAHAAGGRCQHQGGRLGAPAFHRQRAPRQDTGAHRPRRRGPAGRSPRIRLRHAPAGPRSRPGAIRPRRQGAGRNAGPPGCAPAGERLCLDPRAAAGDPRATSSMPAPWR